MLKRHAETISIRKPSRVRRWLASLLIVIGALVLIGVGWFTWMVNRPRTCAIEAPGPTGTRVDEAGMLANFFPASGVRPEPAVLVVGGSEGGLSRNAKRDALALQAAGFNALQVAYHCAPGKPNGLVRVPLETFGQALDWLKRRPEVDPNAVGVVGYSKGAEAALLVASRRPDVRAVAAGMPSSVAWDGIGLMSWVFKGARSSWTERGHDVPSLPYGSMSSDRGDTYGLHANGLKLLAEHRHALIPVDRIRAPVLLACGDLDRVWPACEMARRVASGLTRAGRPAPILLRYSRGGHGVFGTPYPSGSKGAQRWGSMGGLPDDNTAARREGWPKVVAFLELSLKEN